MAIDHPAGAPNGLVADSASTGGGEDAGPARRRLAGGGQPATLLKHWDEILITLRDAE